MKKHIAKIKVILLPTPYEKEHSPKNIQSDLFELNFTIEFMQGIRTLQLPWENPNQMSKKPDSFSALNRYLPPGSLDLVRPLLLRYPIQLKISKPRKTKFGDYRIPREKEAHRISVNGDLNPYAFLITLLHEYAHLVTFQKFGTQIKAHGEEWQFCFKEIGTPFIEAGIFPENLEMAFRASLARGHASSATDHQLLRVLRDYDPIESTKARTFVEDLNQGALFELNSKVFRKGPKSRKRYKCEEIQSKRQFMVHPLAEVTLWNDTNEH